MGPARAVAALLVVAIVAAGALGVLVAGPASARSAAAGMKAVVIVGPASSSTQEYLDEGEKIARQAEAQDMDVRRIFTPHATWSRVKANIQDANLVVYLGHGNGWPSSMGPFQGETKDGLGLNECDSDCGTSSPVKYYGEDFIRHEVKLAPKAVVYLHRLCYASGNAESGMAPVFNKDLATERASNFASGFLDAGAGVVFALGWGQKLNLPAALATTRKSMDEIFMTRGSDYPQAYDGFQGWDDYYRKSTRTRGARVHLDPHKRYGHLRAITGNLELTAAEWRGEAPPPDNTPPTLRIKRMGTTDGTAAAGSRDVLTFSPNGDGVAERMVVDRTLSEPAYIDIKVRNDKGRTVKAFTRFGDWGEGRSFWDGRNDAGDVVRDGRYQVRLTPRDRSGNVGKTVSVAVRVLTSLRRLKSSVHAINVADGDNLADSVKLTASLRRDAVVTWEIRQGHSRIRTRFEAKAVHAGDLAWRWDGTNDAGAIVPNGHYTAFIAATTDEGTLRYSVPIQVGDWRLRASDRTPRRGAHVRLHAFSVEPLKGVPTLEITQPGLAPRVVDMKLLDRHRAAVTFHVANRGDPGRMRLRVVATDTGGQKETHSLTLRLH